MVKARALMATMLALAVAAPAAAPALAQARPVDFSDEPFVIFAPAPPKPAEIAHYPIPDGAEDYWDLWAPDAPWQDALERIDAFATHGWILRYSSSDEDLQRMLAWLDERDIPLAMEVEPLTWPGPETCDHTESFEGPYELDQARRIRALGGRIDFIAFDEPYSHAHKLTGPGACRYPVEQVVDEAWDFVQEFRGLHPGVQVGSIEPLWSDPEIGARDMEVWLDTWAERTGEPFAFLSVDIDWRRDGWPEIVREVEAVADARGVPLGVLYLGGEAPRDNDAWLAQLAMHAATLEVGHGVTPDIVGFYSWQPLPDRLLPDDDLDAYTGRINQYFGTRTRFERPAAGGKAVSGRLLTEDGDPVAGAVVEVSAEPLDGGRARHRLTGTVPAGAREALVAVRANVEGGTPAAVNVRLSQISYREAGRRRNLVPNPRFARGLESWGPYGSGAVAVVRDGDGRAMRLKAGRSQTIFVDGERFRVTPGAEFEFAATIDVPRRSLGSGYVSVIFLGDQEFARENLWFTSRPGRLPSVTTDEQGRYRVPLGTLQPGRYELALSYGGDLGRWAATTQERIRVR